MPEDEIVLQSKLEKTVKTSCSKTDPFELTEGKSSSVKSSIASKSGFSDK